MNKRYRFDRIFLTKKITFKGGISYVFNYTKDLSATTVMRNVRKNEWNVEIEERKEDKIKAKYIYIQVDEDHVKERNTKR